jgi:hypothetical protein
MSDGELFVGYEVSTGVIPAFFIESTAPVNIDDPDGKVLPTPDGCVRLRLWRTHLKKSRRSYRSKRNPSSSSPCTGSTAHASRC